MLRSSYSAARFQPEARSQQLTLRGPAGQLLAQIGGDELAVEASILDEDFIGARAGHDYTRHVDSRHIALQRLRVANRAALLRRKLNSHAGQEVVIGVVAGHGENKIV